MTENVFFRSLSENSTATGTEFGGDRTVVGLLLSSLKQFESDRHVDLYLQSDRFSLWISIV
ncbi:hypothetical protein [Baaleninema sp.]|uniref:hypothetical protein n=1 Tax=Baaleninema sp. TaxID=3101197 RepID=UPI003D006F06